MSYGIYNSCEGILIRMAYSGSSSSLQCKTGYGETKAGQEYIIGFQAMLMRVTVQFEDPFVELVGNAQVVHCELPTESEY